jgi:hypothetical protein
MVAGAAGGSLVPSADEVESEAESESDSESDVEETVLLSAFRFFEISSCFILSESCSNLMCALARSFACLSAFSKSYLSLPDCYQISKSRKNQIMKGCTGVCTYQPGFDDS